MVRWLSLRMPKRKKNIQNLFVYLFVCYCRYRYCFFFFIFSIHFFRWFTFRDVIIITIIQWCCCSLICMVCIAMWWIYPINHWWNCVCVWGNFHLNFHCCKLYDSTLHFFFLFLVKYRFKFNVWFRLVKYEKDVCRR